jgi:hypothetical protein
VWTRDGQVIYLRRTEGTATQLARIRPGATASPEILATYPTGDAKARTPLAVSPDGTWILARSTTSAGQLFLVATDLSRERPMPSEPLSGPMAFSKDGREVMSLHQATTATGASWQLWAVDVATLRERLVTHIDFPDTVEWMYGFSLHPADIWMLSGFNSR